MLTCKHISELVGAPLRYWRFLVVAWSAPFFDDAPRFRVLPVIFAPMFILEIQDSAGRNALSYVLLKSIIDNSSLSLVVGVTDAIISCMSIAIKLDGRWNRFMSSVADRPSGAITGAVLYCLGAITLIISSYGKSRMLSLSVYVFGVFLINRGINLLWNTCSVAFKDHGKRRIELFEAEDEEQVAICPAENTRGDIDAKVMQLQVMCRFAAGSIGPLLATHVLFERTTYAYLVLVVIVAVLGAAMAIVVRRIDKDESTQVTNVNSNVTWRTVLPVRLISGLPQPYDGHFNAPWFQSGLLIAFTEVVRGGFTRVLCLRALSMGLSQKEIALALAVVGGTAVSSFWLSDIADRNRRLAAVISFAVLGLGHLGLSLSTSLNGVLFSSVMFGLGEGFSCGLRALNASDCRHRDGPMGHLSRTFVSVSVSVSEADIENNTDKEVEVEVESKDAELVRRQVQSMTGIWLDIGGLFNSMMVGLVGGFLGMRVTSLLYAVVAMVAVYSSALAPDSKPTLC